MSRYAQRFDNEGWTEQSGVPFKIACCHCGLVHQMVIVAGKKGELGIAAKQDLRATAAMRRKKK